MVSFDYYLQKANYNENIEPDQEASKLQEELISMLKKIKVNKEQINVIKKEEEKILGATSLSDIKDALKSMVSLLKNKPNIVTEAAEKNKMGKIKRKMFDIALGDLPLITKLENKLIDMCWEQDIKKILNKNEEKKLVNKLKELILNKFFGKGI